MKNLKTLRRLNNIKTLFAKFFRQNNIVCGSVVNVELKL